MGNPEIRSHSVISWLLGEGRRITDPKDFLDALAARLRQCGVPVIRITTGVPILHPNLWSFGGLWELGKGTSERGMGETICAVIWLCDLRGFTELSESLARDHLIEVLNQYFGAMTDAVEGDGGEVLKFIGDAMLAILPIGASADAEAACTHALSAATRAQAVIATINNTRKVAGRPVIDYGIALHVGDVMYGKIGGETRLDFTVIGPAVNLAARIEGLCGQLGRKLLMSYDFVRTSGKRAKSVGKFELKGVGATQTVYAPTGSQHAQEI